MASWVPTGNNGVVIERPCVSCGISLEKGARYVAIANIIVGFGFIVLWTALIIAHSRYDFAGHLPTSESATVKPHTSESHIQSVEEFEAEDYRIYHGIFIVFLTMSVIQVVLAMLLKLALKRNSIPLMYTWLIISGLTLPGYGVYILVKLYEMIVVFAYLEELSYEASSTALAKFRELPYYCNIESQVYPAPVYGHKIPSKKGSIIMRHGSKNAGGFMERKSTTAYYQNKTFLINNMSSSVFTTVSHYNRL